MFSAIQCPPPIDPPNVNIVEKTAPYYYNTHVVFECTYGFELTGGDLALTCSAEKTWVDKYPVCTGKVLSVSYFLIANACD